VHYPQPASFLRIRTVVQRALYLTAMRLAFFTVTAMLALGAAGTYNCITPPNCPYPADIDVSRSPALGCQYPMAGTLTTSPRTARIAARSAKAAARVTLLACSSVSPSARVSAVRALCSAERGAGC
jgi:hypothetical protein